LGWFNWQNEKTQRDLKALMTNIAPLFDTFIVDDFLCTGDVSAESREAKGERSWGAYRRDLMVEMAQKLFVDPARAENPDIAMIIKYPQWYDRFHLFGYDTERLPQLFDRVWVGTEVRDARTQRFGFTQMYEAYTNYRWLSSIAGEKIGGAWFDHIECGDYDVLDQAYMSVLAGAQEFTLFNFSNILEGHPDHVRLIAEYDQLADLAVHVKNHPVVGAMAYKPPNSEPGGDMYLFDFLGMLGASIVLTADFPEDARAIFLGTQAAADPDIADKARAAHEQGTTLVLTTGFLASEAGASLTHEAGIKSVTPEKMRGGLVDPSGSLIEVPRGLDLAALVETNGADTLLMARADGKDVPFVTKHNKVFVINTRTFDQQDFDAVGEVLLSPRELGILDVPRWAASIVRAAFNEAFGFRFEAPSRVTCQMLADGSFVVQSNRLEAAAFSLSDR
jgi:hypothetical protein